MPGSPPVIKTLLLSTLYSALRAYLGSGLYDRIAAEVLFLTGVSDLSGSDKMARVIAFAKRRPTPSPST